MTEFSHVHQIKAQGYLPVSSFNFTIDNSSTINDDTSNESQQIDNMFESENEPFITYSNPIYGFDLEYPSDWSFTESEIPPNATAYSIVNFVPPISADPNLGTNLMVGIENFEVGQTPSLDQYVRSSIDAYRDSYANFSLDSVRTNTTMSGIPAYEIVFTDNSAESTRKSIDKGIIDETNNRAYYLIFNADNSTYNQFLPKIQDIFDTFNLVGSSLLDEDTGGGETNDSFFSFQDDDASLDNFFSSGQESSGMEGMGGQQAFEQFMNSFAESIFNGSSTFGAVGTSMVNGVKVSGITIEDKSNYSASNISSPDAEEDTQLTVSLTSSASSSNNNSSISVIAIRIPFNIQNMLSLASLSEGSTLDDIGGGTNPLENQELFQDFNPFELLSNLQIGSTSLVNPDWSTTQSLTLSLIGGGRVTNSSLTQTEEDTLDLVFVSVIPYTGG
ncbi:MAG: hypothetical protein ACRD8Z_10585 [Nitrososphaeraceae archaeon]